MIRNWFLLLLVFSWWGCSEPRPKGVLAPEKMQAVLYDLLRADEMAAQQALKDSAWSRLDTHAGLYQQIFQVQGITREDFQTSLRYYEDRPDELKKLVEDLQQKAEQRQRGDTSRPVRKFIPDSGGRVAADSGRAGRCPRLSRSSSATAAGAPSFPSRTSINRPRPKITM